MVFSGEMLCDDIGTNAFEEFVKRLSYLSRHYASVLHS